MDQRRYDFPSAWVQEQPVYSIPDEPIYTLHAESRFVYNPDPGPKPDNSHDWFTWHVFIPLQGTFVGDSELLRAMAERLTYGHGVQSTRKMEANLCGGVFWKLWITRAFIVSCDFPTIEPRARQQILDLWVCEQFTRRMRDRTREIEFAQHEDRLRGDIRHLNSGRLHDSRDAEPERPASKKQKTATSATARNNAGTTAGGLQARAEDQAQTEVTAAIKTENSDEDSDEDSDDDADADADDESDVEIKSEPESDVEVV